jgi:hypothetical protein
MKCYAHKLVTSARDALPAIMPEKASWIRRLASRKRKTADVLLISTARLHWYTEY